MDYKRIREAKELAVALPQAYGADDTCAAFLFQYVPEAGQEEASATATFVQGGAFTVTSGGAVPGDTDADAFGSSGVVDTSAASYDTVGEFVNYVNSTRAWRAICLCRPETPMANVLAKSSTSCLVNTGLVFYLDTSVADTTYIYNYPITGSCFENYGLAGMKKDADDLCVNRFHMAQIKINFSSAATAYLYVFKQGDTTSTLVYTKSLADNTLTDVGNATQPDVPFYTAPEGYTLVMDIRSDAYSGTTGAICVLGSTIVRKNNRVVKRLPYNAS